MMQKILKGDTSAAISIALADGFDYSNATVEVAYQGVVRKFTSCSSGQTLTFTLTASETSTMALGAYPLTVRIIGASGSIVTVTNAGVKIAVTDCVADVRSGSTIAVDVHGGLYGVDDLPDHYTVKDLREKINEIIAKLGGTVSTVLLVMACHGVLAAGVTAAKATLEDLDASTAAVVTNVTFEASGLATTQDVQAAEASAKAYTDQSIQAAGSVSPQIVTNISASVTSNVVTRPFVESLGIGLDTNAVNSLIATATNAVSRITDGSNAINADRTAAMFVPDTSAPWEPSHTPIPQSPVYGDTYHGNISFGVYGSKWSSTCYMFNGNLWIADTPLPMEGEQANDPNATELTFPYVATKTYRRRQITTRLATTNDIDTATKRFATTNALNTVSSQVSAIGAYLNAEDARFVSTNYNSVTQLPEAYVEIKLPDQSWSVIWREMTRWNWLFDTYLPTNFYNKANINTALSEKADRAWGAYDSETGGYAPDGYTWLSSPRIAISGGLAYQKTLTSEGAVWVLESNGTSAETSGVTSNGFFRISDDEGNVQFEIVKGTRRTVGADASSVQVVQGFTPTKLQIGYSVVSDAHPLIYVSDNITNDLWKAETDADCLATVTWSGSSGAWVAQVQGKTAQPALFVKASYETGAESVIRNAIPVQFSHLYLGGVKYAVGTATISGQTVLTLTPAP